MTDLKITQQTLDNHQVLLSIEAPDARVEKAMRAAAAQTAKRYRFPGFRSGKAPYHVIVQRLGREALLQEAMEKLGPELYTEAIEAAGIAFYAPGALTDISYDPLILRFEVPLTPVVDPGDYRSLRVPPIEVDETERAQAVEKTIDQFLRQHTIWAPVERPVRYGDLVTIAIKIQVNDEVVLENDDWDITPDAQDYTLSPVFDAAFVGMNIGDQKSFTTTFPADNQSAWAGEEGHFEVEVKGIKGKELPELDDELAQTVSEFETAAALRQHIEEDIWARLQATAAENYISQAFAALSEQATCVYPPVSLENELEQTLKEQDSLYRNFGFNSLEHFLRLSKKSEEEFKEDLRPFAAERLQQRLLLDAIAEREQFPVSDYELQNYLATAELDAENLADYQRLLAEGGLYRAYITALVLRQKARELFLALVKGEEVPGPGEHVAQEAPPPAAEISAENADAAESEAASQPAESADATLTAASGS